MDKYSSQDLTGYLLGALESHEERAIESALAKSESLRNQLADVEDKLTNLPDRFVEIDPPTGLAEKTLNTISIVDRSIGAETLTHRATSLPSSTALPPITLSPASDQLNPGKRSWSVLDLIVGSAVCLVIAAIMLPSIANSRFQSNIVACQNNLRIIGQDLASIADGFDGSIAVHRNGNRIEVSQYVQRMLDADMSEDTEGLICPGDPRKQDTARICNAAWSSPSRYNILNDYRKRDSSEIVSLETVDSDFRRSELQRSELQAPELLTPEFDQQQTIQCSTDSSVNPYVYSEAACGSYGFAVPRLHETSAQFVTVAIPSNVNEVLSADAGCFDNPDYRSQNHQGKGQNVLLGDLSVSYIRDSTYLPTGDHIYKNHMGKVQPGYVPGDNLIFRGIMYVESLSR